MQLNAENVISVWKQYPDEFFVLNQKFSEFSFFLSKEKTNSHNIIAIFIDEKKEYPNCTANLQQTLPTEVVKFQYECVFNPNTEQLQWTQTRNTRRIKWSKRENQVFIYLCDRVTVHHWINFFIVSTAIIGLHVTQADWPVDSDNINQAYFGIVRWDFVFYRNQTLVFIKSYRCFLLMFHTI